jgi:excisionase family DNA binding protein
MTLRDAKASAKDVFPASGKESFLRPKEVAARLDLHVASVYRKIEAGLIPAVRLGRKRSALRIPADEFERWLYGPENGA